MKTLFLYICVMNGQSITFTNDGTWYRPPAYAPMQYAIVTDRYTHERAYIDHSAKCESPKQLAERE